MLLLTFLSLAAPPPGVVAGQGLVCREQAQQADLDRDGVPECYRLAGFRLTATGGGYTIWQSPAGWQVTQFVLADSTNKGITELNMVVWRRGNFGVYRPFWFQGPDTEYCNHLYVFILDHGKMRPVWMSSKLDPPIARLSIYDADGDGRNELVVTERHPLSEMPGGGTGVCSGRAGDNGGGAGDTGRGGPGDAGGGAGDTGRGGLSYWRWQVWGFVRVQPPKCRPRPGS
jgi:hypothetical protein